MTPEPLSAAREPVGFAAGGAALHVNDLPVSECQHLEAFVADTIDTDELGRGDDLVVTNLPELGLNLEPHFTALPDLQLQCLAGTIGAVTHRRVLPPQVTVRDAAPLRILLRTGLRTARRHPD